MKYDRNKALHALLYLCDHLPRPTDVYTALKVIYFADKLHLERFGRSMFGETYIAMDNGPVPSGAYDIVKYVGGRAKYDLEFPEAHSSLCATKTTLSAKQSPKLDFFSRSELMCLTHAAREFGGLNFEQLKRLSHDEAWKRADANGEMELEDIVRTLPNSELVAAHLHDRTPGQEAPMPVAIVEVPQESVDA
jgi:uncharacterized phage-associated protein